MKAVINRKRYDTDTATELAGWGQGLPGWASKWWYVTLYVTKAGNHFRHEEGSDLSKYAPSCKGGRKRVGASGITPMTYEEAVAYSKYRWGAGGRKDYAALIKDDPEVCVALLRHLTMKPTLIERQT
jgi:hypothetical protein